MRRSNILVLMTLLGAFTFAISAGKSAGGRGSVTAPAAADTTGSGNSKNVTANGPKADPKTTDKKAEQVERRRLLKIRQRDIRSSNQKALGRQIDRAKKQMESKRKEQSGSRKTKSNTGP